MERIAQADVVVLACPLTKETKGMFGASQFAAMKKSAYFINIARGGLVDQNAMLAALKKNAIAGAGLDVTDPEPLPDNHVLWTMPNVAISPHLGADRMLAGEMAALQSAILDGAFTGDFHLGR